MSADYTADEYDLLRETVNVAMGAAGAELAELLGTFVELSIPDVRIVTAEVVAREMTQGGQLGGNEKLTAIRQTFYGGRTVEGEAIVIFDEGSPATFARVIGVAAGAPRLQQLELLLEMANLLTGACLNGITRQLFGIDVGFDPPEVLVERMDLRALSYGVFQRRQLRWDQMLVLRIQFRLEKESLKSDLFVLMSEQSIETVRRAVAETLARI